VIVFVCALHAEARAVIEYYTLKKHSSSPFELYMSDLVAVVISGMGRMCSAVATSHILTRFSSISCIVNLGIAGSKCYTYSLGSMCLIHKIHCKESGRSFFPDIFHPHVFDESALETHAQPIGNNKNAGETLVDMEGSGFFEAASLYIAPHKIMLYKIVSDHLSVERPSKEQIYGWIRAHMESINSYLVACQNMMQTPEILSKEDQLNVLNIQRALRLTRTQCEQLNDLAKYQKIIYGNLEKLAPYVNQHASSKGMRDSIFFNIRRALAQ
jgi:adenosylhomocysteine nucleosidase